MRQVAFIAQVRWIFENSGILGQRVSGHLQSNVRHDCGVVEEERFFSMVSDELKCLIGNGVRGVRRALETFVVRGILKWCLDSLMGVEVFVARQHVFLAIAPQMCWIVVMGHPLA